MNFKVKKAYYRLFSVLLSLVMIVISVPISASAELSSGDATETSEAIPSANLGKIESGEISLPINPAEMTAVTDDIITDGVYAFRNVNNPNMWLDTGYSSPLPDSYMQQYAYWTSPAATNAFFVGGLFKIKRLGSTTNPSYVIRLMTNNELIFRPNTTTGYVNSMKESPVDTEVYSANRYLLQKTAAGYIIKLLGSPYCIAAPQSNVSGEGTVDSRLTYLSPTEAQTNTRAQWQLYRYEGDPVNQLILHDYPTEMIESEIRTVFGYVRSTYVGSNGPVSYSVSETDNSITNKATINSASGELTAHSTGQIKLWANAGTIVQYTIVNITQNVVGRYFFNNVKYPNKYAQINNNNTMLDSGEIIELHPFSEYDYQKWRVVYVANGYYKIVSKYSGLELTAPTGYGNDVVTQTDTSSDNTHLWKFIKQSDGTYKISPKSNSNCFLAAGDIASAADQDLEIRSVQSDGGDKWYLDETNDSYSFNIVHYYDGGYDCRFNGVPSDIQNYQEICSSILLELFNVNVEHSIESFTSSADKCKGETYIKSACNHSTKHKTHEMLRENIITQYGPGNQTTTKVIWTGHALEDWQSNSHSGNHTIVMTIDRVTTGSPNYTNKAPEIIRDQRLFTLLHEISHQLGTVDHYCYDDSYFGCSSDNCWKCDLKLESEPICLMSSNPILDLKVRLENDNLVGIYCHYCMNNASSKGIPQHLNDHH